MVIYPPSHSSFDWKLKHAFNFRYSDEKLIPFRVSKKLDCEFNLDLLLLSDGTMHHYVLIRNLKSLVHKVRKRDLRIDNHLCRNCFHVCSSKARYEKHISCCQEKKPAILRMPAEKKKLLHIKKNYKLAGLLQWLAFLISSQSLSRSRLVETTHSSPIQELLKYTNHAAMPCCSFLKAKKNHFILKVNEVLE